MHTTWKSQNPSNLDACIKGAGTHYFVKSVCGNKKGLPDFKMAAKLVKMLNLSYSS
jgi:hypothetical protein